jgi:hypothetical protein
MGPLGYLENLGRIFLKMGSVRRIGTKLQGIRLTTTTDRFPFTQLAARNRYVFQTYCIGSCDCGGFGLFFYDSERPNGRLSHGDSCWRCDAGAEPDASDSFVGSGDGLRDSGSEAG